MLVGSSDVSVGDSESEIIVPRPGEEEEEEDDDWGIVSVDEDVSDGELILDEDDEEEKDGFEEEKEQEEEPELISENYDEKTQGSQPMVLGNTDDSSKESTRTVDAQVPTSVPVTSPHSNRLVFLLVVPALLLVPTIASVYLYKERNTLQTSVLELEDTVSSLHLEAEQRKLEEELLWEDKEFLQLSSRELQEKVIQLKKEADGNKIQKDLVDHLHKERSTLKLYILHLQDKVDSLKKKADKEKREGDVLFQDKKFLEWSAASLQEKLQKLKLEVAQKEQEEQLRLEALHQEKQSLEGQLKQFQDEISRVKKESDRKLREEELRWNSLFQEKISLRVTTAQLEDQIMTLKKKIKINRHQEAPRRAWYRKERDVLLDMVANLEDEVLALREEAEARKNADNILNLNSCGAEAGEVVLFDNCWINARLGNCANDAKHVMEGAFHGLSESFSHWMHSYSSTRKSAARSTSQNSTPRLVAAKNNNIRKVAKKLENATTIQQQGNWNATTVDESIGTSVAKMMRSVDSFGRALWNATAFHMHKKYSNVSRHKQGRSFFSRMDLNGKLWFESFFPASSNHNALRIYKNTTSGLDRVFQKVSDIILAASHPDEVLEQASVIFFAKGKNSSMNASETFMASAMEKFFNSVAFNQTSKKYLMKAAKQTYKEVSLYRPNSFSM